MVLAITSLDVALASAIVAGIAAFASPGITWVTTKAQLKDAREQRSYADRREAYRSILVDLFKGKYYVQDWIEELTNDRAATALEIITRYDAALDETVDDAIKRSAEIGVFGPEDVVKAHRDFIAAWNAATGPLTPPTRFRDMTDDDIRTAALTTLTDGLNAMQEPMEKLRIAVRDDLVE